MYIFVYERKKKYIYTKDKKNVYTFLDIYLISIISQTHNAGRLDCGPKL